jgi:hypothetical protein
MVDPRCLLGVAVACALTACGSSHSGANPDGGSDSRSNGTDAGPGTPSSCSAFTTGLNASLGGTVPFPANNARNQDVSAADVDPNSDAILTYIGKDSPFHPDFDSSGGGISYEIVDSTTTPLVTIALDDDSESDLMPMPFDANAQVEGGSDSHALVIDKATCWLYELFHASYDGSTWSAANSAVWDLESYNSRPLTWTSADAAGLPIMPGLVRYDEVSAGVSDPALRVTMPATVAAFVPPATHYAGNDDSSPVPMGMRLRLMASVDTSNYSPADQAILNAMKKYGLIVADNGSALFVTGTGDSRWDDDDLHKLTALHVSDFEVVKMPTMTTKSNVPSGDMPAIASFTASAMTASAGAAITLTWSASSSSYDFITPSAGDDVGVARGGTAVVHPMATTTYTLSSTNAYGRATKTLTITVQ